MSRLAPPAEPDRRTHPVVYAVAGVIVAVVLVALAAAVMSRFNAPRESFNFVGSAIKPTAPGAPAEDRRMALEAAAGARQAEAQRAAAEAARGPAAPGDAAAPPPPKVEPVDRKIIYTARLDLVVKSLDEAEKKVDDLLTSHGGRLVRSESRGDAGAKRSASFTLEVPSAKFRPFVSALRQLGVPERDSVDSQDVTEEYVDIQTRVKHLKAEEDNLLKLLAERARSVEEQLAIRRQIQPLREQIERAEGRQKYIEAKAALSTVTLSLREEANYVPPTVEPPPSPPTFGDRVAGTFASSWASLVSVGQGVALFAVAVGPWLPFVIPLGLVGYWAARRLGDSVAGSPQPARVTVTEPPARPQG